MCCARGAVAAFLAATAVSFAVGSVVLLTFGGLSAGPTIATAAADSQQKQQQTVASLCRGAFWPQSAPDVARWKALLLPPGDRRCPRHATLAFKQRAGLGHRVSNFLMLIAAASAFGIAPAPPSDFDNCSRHAWHGCYRGAWDALGLFDVAPTVVEALWADPRTETRALSWRPGSDGDINGLGWGAISSWADAQQPPPTRDCHSVLRLREAWFRDLSFGRWALSAAMEQAQVPAAVKGLYNASLGLAVALHLRYGNDTEPERRKVVHDAWLQRVMDALSSAASERRVPHHFYAFCGGSPWPWLLARTDTTVIGKELPAAETVRALALADVLVCGPSSMCLVAAWASTRALSFTAYSRENFGKDRDFNTCPPGIVCIDEDGVLQPPALARLSDTLDLWKLRHSIGCPPVWDL